jgi:hypothetical protein
MNCGIAEVSGDGISTVNGMNALEVPGYFIKGFVPSDALPTVRSAANRMFQPVFIIVEISQGSGLRADVPAAERVVFVTADVETVSSSEFGVSSLELIDYMVRVPDGFSVRHVERILNSDLDPTDRFAEIAVAIMN